MESRGQANTELSLRRFPLQTRYQYIHMQDFFLTCDSDAFAIANISIIPKVYIEMI